MAIIIQDHKGRQCKDKRDDQGVSLLDPILQHNFRALWYKWDENIIFNNMSFEVYSGED
jgi:hypothetical protein